MPGAPLTGGFGWRIWCSRAGRDDFVPGAVTVRRAGAPVSSSIDWQLGKPVEGLERRVGILTVRLSDSEASTHAGTAYELTIGGSSEGPFSWRTLPRTLGEGVRFLFASCFWLDADKEGAFAAGMRFLHDTKQPAFKLHVGDQLYLDFPIPAYHNPLLEFPRNLAKTVGEMGARYESYWGNAPYRRALQLAPSCFTCDDHEYWNNYPEDQLWLAGSRGDRHDITQKAAELTYDAFQRQANPGGRGYFDFEIGQVSVFVTDARSERSDLERGPRPGSFFSPGQWKALDAWAGALRGPGVLVLAQPLFDKPGGKTDRSLSSFEGDFGHLCDIFEQALRRDVGSGSHDILVLSGDIHTGRYARATVVGLNGLAHVHEFIASPTSRVGPYVTEPKPKPPPPSFNAKWQGATRLWDIDAIDYSSTVDNNVGVVTMSPGTNGRVRFELELWRVRKLNKRSLLHPVVGKPDKQGPIVRLFRRELQLR